MMGYLYVVIYFVDELAFTIDEPLKGAKKPFIYKLRVLV
jgi:hypothetical protein